MPSKKRKEKRKSKKGGSVWRTCIMLIHPVKPKKKKRKKEKEAGSTFTPSQPKNLKMKCRQFCPNIFGHLSLLFSLQFGKIVFWQGRREILWAPPKSLPFSTLNQITTNTIFSPLFSTSFSILPIITPTKQSLNIYCQEMQDVKYKRVSNFY